MTPLAVMEAVAGAVSIYVGVRFAIARAIPIVSEGSDKPLAWITGKAAVAIGICIAGVGVALLAAAFGWLHML